MRFAIIADIHANLSAFTAVLDDMKEFGGIDKVWCLGDIVGYGPDPHECIELLRSIDHICVAGNHDRAAIEELDLHLFNPHAAATIEWTKEQLTGNDRLFLKLLPNTYIHERFTLVHGTPRNVYLEYMSSLSIARENFPALTTDHGFCGHTHIPRVFNFGDDGNCTMAKLSPELKLIAGDNRLFVNPGSIGQPRDGDPRASYAVYDEDTGIIRLRRVSYDIKETQDRMIKNNLPINLISRLDMGN